MNSFFANCTCDGTISDVTNDQNHKEKFWGLGPEIGVKANWDLGCDFSLYGSVGVGLLYGNFQIRANDFQTIPDPTDSGASCVHRSVRACQAIADAAIGVQW